MLRRRAAALALAALALLAAAPARAETPSERLAAALREYFERGWHEVPALRAAEAAEAEAWARRLEDGIAPGELPAEDRLDRTLALHRVRGLLDRFASRRLARASAEAWLPRWERISADLRAERGEQARERLEEAAAGLRQAPRRLTELRREDASEGLSAAARTKKDLEGAVALARKEHARAWAAAEPGWQEFESAMAAFRTWLEGRRDAAPALDEAERKARRWTEYVLNLRWEIGLEESPLDVLKLGEREFRRTERELEALAERIEPGRGWRAIAEDLRDDHPEAGELLDVCRAELDRALAFTLEKGFVTVPEWARNVRAEWGDPRSPTPYGHYNPCNRRDPALRGTYVVTPVTRLRDEEREEVLRGNNRAWIRVVALHEAIPGHHLQFAIAARRDREIRRHFYNAAFVEGWGLYCEETMHRYGYYDDRTRLSQLKMRLWRCARAIIDVGAHFGGMTREEAIRLLAERVGLERPSAAMEVDRYLSAPGYYSGYLIGLTQIEALRRDARDARGPAFTDRDFHDRLLAYGPLPFRALKQAFQGVEDNRGK